MKKIFSLLLCLALIGSFAVFALASGESDSEEEENPNALGDYEVEILSYRMSEDILTEEPVIVILFKFTNNSSSAASFSSLEVDAYQDGVGLIENYFVSDVETSDQSKQLKSGASIEVEVAFDLNNTTSDVEVEVTEFFSFDDKTVTKTFSIR